MDGASYAGCRRETALLRCGYAGCRAQRRRAPGAREQRFDTLRGAAGSRGSVARQCARPGAAVDADGGGRPNTSGTMGSGARNIVANSAGRSRLRWRAVRTTLARTCWVSAAFRVRLPPHTLRMTTAGRMAMFGAPVGGVDRRVPQEREEGREFDGQVGGEALGVVVRRRVVDQPADLGEQSAAGGGQAVVADTTGVAPVAQREGGLQGVLHLSGPPAVGMVLQQIFTRRSRCCRQD